MKLQNLTQVSSGFKQNRQLLIVEKTLAFRNFFASLFTKAGHTVACLAKDEDEAFCFLKTSCSVLNLSPNSAVEAIIVSLLSSHYSIGLQAIQHFRVLGFKGVILVVVNHDTKEPEQVFQESGADGIFICPFHIYFPHSTEGIFSFQLANVSLFNTLFYRKRHSA